MQVYNIGVFVSNIKLTTFNSMHIFTECISHNPENISQQQRYEVQSMIQ